MALSFLSGETRWGLPAHHSRDGLRWEDGTGSFEGGQVALLGRCTRTGATASLLKMPSKTLMDSHDGRMHVHTSTSHTFVLEGQVSAVLGGNELTAGPGDYFRLPAGSPHQGSIIPVGDVLMFVLTDGDFGLEFVDEKQSSAVDSEGLAGTVDWALPGFHQSKQRSWQKGEGAFAGGEVAVFGHCSRSGATASLLRMPAKTLLDSHDGQLHCHTSTAHNLIVEGSVSALINGTEVVGKAGDYFRLPAGFPHEGSIVPQTGTTILTMTENEFDTVIIQ